MAEFPTPMPLVAGTRLGSYEIVAPIGAGAAAQPLTIVQNWTTRLRK